jgi:hypothetical protein
MPERPAQFSRRAAERIVDATMRTENAFYSSRPPTDHPAPWTTGTIEAIVTTAITPANGTTYGVGAAQPYISTFNSTFNSNTNTYTNSYIAVPDYSYATTTVNGNTNTTVNSVTVLNWSQNSNTIAVNTHVLIAWRNGNFLFVSGDC